MEKVIIAAVSENGVIGKDRELPWPHISRDFSRFRRMTLYHPVIMGRKTYESLPQKSRPLAMRRNIVLSRDERFNYYLTEKNGKITRKQRDHIVVCYSLEEALQQAEQYNDNFSSFLVDFSDDGKPLMYSDEVYIAGGGGIYQQTIGLADRMEITRIHKVVEGDTSFPEINSDVWKEAAIQSFPAEGNVPAFSFVTYEKRRA